jgi:hypothetical protein
MVRLRKYDLPHKSQEVYEISLDHGATLDTAPRRATALLSRQELATLGTKIQTLLHDTHKNQEKP